ncbi:MAG: sulfate/molybdate ABC transporter ATP-binding protein [Candidatus Acidiferrales bacterium]
MELDVQIEKKLPSGFSLEVAFRASGAPLGILGPSGAGKSLTLRTIAGLERPDRGRIVLDGRVLFDSAAGVDCPSRDRRVGLLFQNYALFPHLTVAENIGFGISDLPKDERDRRIARQIAALHLAGLEARSPAALSGGQQQRVALARALAPEPEALLLDEPFSALDTHLRGEIERELREALAKYRGVALFVSHNLEEAYRFCGELVVLANGKIAAAGPKEDLFRRPPNFEVARLTGCKNFSRAGATPDGAIEALDWGCRLRVAQSVPSTLGHIAIRAHHVRVHAADAQVRGASGGAGENTFPCWLAAATEAPFRVTLYLRLHARASASTDFQLQAEISKDVWETFKNEPQPWQVDLSAERLFLLPN